MASADAVAGLGHAATELKAVKKISLHSESAAYNPVWTDVAPERFNAQVRLVPEAAFAPRIAFVLL